MKKEAFGRADYILAFAVSFLITKETWPFFLIFCGFFGVISALIVRSKKFPFIAGILLSTMCCEFIKNFLGN